MAGKNDLGGFVQAPDRPTMKLIIKCFLTLKQLLRLLRQNQFTQARRLQTVGEAVVVDFHRFLATQNFGAVQARR